MIGRISKVRKRDGRLVAFDETKIADAVHKAGCAVGRADRFLAEELAGVVTLFLEKRHSGQVPGIEEIQDMVEKVLIETGHARLAKAYILYRERRARAREQVRVRGETGGGPLVGNPAKALVSPWSKSRIACALVREADLDDRVAAQVAASVERKVMERGVTSVTTSVIRSLVEAELFERGFADRVGRQALVGLPRYDLDRMLRGAKESRWRPAGPRELKTAVADSVLAQYALSEVYSAEVADAHLGARIHVLDIGSPFEWLAAVGQPAAPAGTPEDWIEALAGPAGRLAGVVRRELLLEGAVPARCAWAEAHAIGAARRLLGHEAFRADSRLRLALAVPGVARDPGAARLAEGIVREHWARFRAGSIEGLPELVVRVPVEAVDGPEARRALLPALAAAAETGRVVFACDRDLPDLVTPWYRIPAPDSSDGPALPVSGAVAVNAGALVGAGEEDLLRALDASVTLAVKALAQKRSFMEALQADPALPLYRVAAGARALVAGARALDLVHLVGIHAAASAVEREPAAVARLAGRLRAYAAVRIAEEGRQVRLRAHTAPELDGEAARRFAQVSGGEPCRDHEDFALPPAARHDAVEAWFEPIGGTLSLRFARDEAPAPEALFDTFCLLARDPRVGAVRLVPWPDRSVRPAADL